MRERLKKFVFAMIVVIGSVLAVRAIAAEPVYTGTFSNKAAGGYDVVAYFIEHKPVRGLPEHAMEWNGAKWLFSSDEHLMQFKENPEKYAPQYGGYCAYAVARGALASSDPEMWTITNDGKLYLNYSEDAQTGWLADRDNLIKKADQNWPELIKK